MRGFYSYHISIFMVVSQYGVVMIAYLGSLLSASLTLGVREGSSLLSGLLGRLSLRKEDQQSCSTILLHLP